MFHRGENDAVIETLFPRTWKDLIESARERLNQVAA
jgi:hypothetical protein